MKISRFSMLLAIAALCLLGIAGCVSQSDSPVTTHTGPVPSHRSFNAISGQWEEAPPYGPQRNSDRG